MATYKNIEENLMKIIEELIVDDTFMRLLTNDGNDALQKPPSISPSEVVYNRIYPYCKVPRNDVVDSQKTFVNVYTDMVVSSSTGDQYYENLVIYIDVICHLDNARVELDGKGRIRWYRLLDIIDEKIRTIKPVSVRGSFISKGSKKLPFGSSPFNGYSLRIEYSDSRGCND